MAVDLIDYIKWMKDTAVTGRFRSFELKALDTAIKNYGLMKTDANQTKVSTAFAAWKGKEGVGWAQSKRNASGAIGKLESQLTPRAATTYTNDQAHSRKGVLYLFAKTELEIGVMSFAKILLEGGSDLVDLGSSLPGSQITSSASNIAQKATSKTISALEYAANRKSAPPSIPNHKSLLDRIIETFKEYVTKIWTSLKTRASEFWNQTPWEMTIDIASYSYKIIQFIAERVLSQAVPFISAGGDIVKGVYQTVTASYDRYQAYSLGKNVVLNSGHPGVVADSIERAMSLGIGQGLYQTLKGGASLAGAIASGGATAILNFIISGCEILAKFCYRIWETVSMRSFFADCKTRWAKADATAWTDSNDFKGWYRNAAYALPCLSALAINSHITGDAMMYMQCFKDASEREVISQANFDQGVSYLTHLKDWSRKYVADAGYEFTSSDPMIKNILANTLSSKPRKIPQLNVDLNRTSPFATSTV